jgi:hypothetical protein
MKMVVFWDVAPCSLIDITLMVEVVSLLVSTRLHGATSQKIAIFNRPTDFPKRAVRSAEVDCLNG